MNVLIVGTGALATLFAARLTEAGDDISMLGTWQAGLLALQKNGARIIDVNGREHAFAVRATDDAREVRGAKHAIVLVKAWQTERAANQLKQCLADDGLALTLQNGLGNYETLIRSLGRTRVSMGSTTTGATLLAPGLVRVGGEGIISLERGQATAEIEAAFHSAKFNVQTVKDARSLIWGKLIINAAINPLTALLRIPNGELLQRPAAHELMLGLAREAAKVARAEKIKLPFTNPARAAEEVARKTAHNHSSMYQDVERGARTEIDAICGAIVRIGKKHKIATPLNAMFWKMISALTAE